MVASKIQDEAEAIRWLQEGRPYNWIIAEYIRKYGIETTPSLWGNLRRKHDIAPRNVRNSDLIPWQVKPEHRYGFPAIMLRAEGRRREGKELNDHDATRLAAWLKRLADEGAVVHYDPETDDGWYYVPRRDKDTDLIRVPD